MIRVASRFGTSERRLAESAWRTYLFEIEGGGLRAEFDRTPDTLDLSDPTFEAHRANPQAFGERASSLLNLSATLGHFTGRVVRDQAPDVSHRWVDVDRTLLPQEVAGIDSFALAVGSYATVLHRHRGSEAGLADVRAAAEAACAVVQPEAWGLEGDNSAIYGGAAKFVLEAIMRGEVPIIKPVAA